MRASHRESLRLGLTGWDGKEFEKRHTLVTRQQDASTSHKTANSRCCARAGNCRETAVASKESAPLADLERNQKFDVTSVMNFGSDHKLPCFLTDALLYPKRFLSQGRFRELIEQYSMMLV